MAQITVEGGVLESAGSWKDASGEVNSFWKATSEHTDETLTFYTKGLAEYFIWVINERVEGRLRRLTYQA